jgi:hypothetical protein
MSTSEDFKTTFKYNLTCTFLSPRAKLKKNTLPSDTLYLYKYLFHIERRNELPRIQIPNKDIVILYAHNTQWSTSTMSEREIVGDVSVFKKLFTSFSLDLSVRVLEEKLYEAKRIFLFKACTTYYIHTRYAINHIFLCLLG